MDSPLIENLILAGAALTGGLIGLYLIWELRRIGDLIAALPVHMEARTPVVLPSEAPNWGGVAVHLPKGWVQSEIPDRLPFNLR